MRAGGVPVMYLVNKVVEALRAASPAALSPGELRAACGVDLAADAEAATLVAANAKVRFDAASGRYAYRATYAVGNKAELLALLVSRPEGTSAAALADAYARVGDDVAALLAEGAIWAVEDSITHDRALFPRDKAYEVAVDPRVKTIWTRVELPTDPDAVAAEMARAGITPAPRRSAFARHVLPLSTEERKKKRKRDFSKLHVTNVHLWDELFAPGSAGDFGEED
jgi:hypothetical protein